MEKKNNSPGFQGWTVKICHSHCNLCLEGDFICSFYCPFQFCQEEHLLENFNVWRISTESQKCDLSLGAVLAQYSVLPLRHKAINTVPPLQAAEDKTWEQLLGALSSREHAFSSKLTVLSSNLEITREPRTLCVCDMYAGKCVLMCGYVITKQARLRIRETKHSLFPKEPKAGPSTGATAEALLLRWQKLVSCLVTNKTIFHHIST